MILTSGIPQRRIQWDRQGTLEMSVSAEGHLSGCQWEWEGRAAPQFWRSGVRHVEKTAGKFEPVFLSH